MNGVWSERRTWVILSVIVGAALFRLFPLPANFAPIGALALFGGAMFGQRWLAFAVPIGAMLLSDMLLGLFWYGADAFLMMPYVYAAVLMIVGLGRLLHTRMKPMAIGGATLAGSLVFFTVTNIGVWAMAPAYPLNPGGLGAALLAGLPFLHWTVLSDAVFVTVLFGGYALAQRHLLRRDAQGTVAAGA